MYKHYSNSKKATTGIDYAIRQYGKENFTVEKIYEAEEDEDLDALEIYYIELYDTYYNGYNLTPGGKLGSSQLNIDKDSLIKDYLSGKTIQELCIPYDCCEKTISNILHTNNIKIRKGGNNPQNIIGKGKQFKEGDNVKAVYIKELNLTFPSLKECAEWLMDNGYSKAKTMVDTRKSISRVLTGERQTYCKLHFYYA